MLVAKEDACNNLERKMSMPERPKYFGLCENCEHDATCMLRRSAQLKIIQCEEFSIQPAAAKTSVPQNGAAIPDPIADVRLGLCVNCLNVATCGFPSARQGVLLCEEYVLDEAGAVPPVRTEHSRSAA
jgi:hypothetical protein